jgi:hypothetical protein
MMNSAAAAQPHHASDDEYDAHNDYDYYFALARARRANLKQQARRAREGARAQTLRCGLC